MRAAKATGAKDPSGNDQERADNKLPVPELWEMKPRSNFLTSFFLLHTQEISSSKTRLKFCKLISTCHRPKPSSKDWLNFGGKKLAGGSRVE